MTGTEEEDNNFYEMKRHIFCRTGMQRIIRLLKAINMRDTSILQVKLSPVGDGNKKNKLLKGENTRDASLLKVKPSSYFIEQKMSGQKDRHRQVSDKQICKLYQNYM